MCGICYLEKRASNESSSQARVSAHLGNADLTFCNEKRQICLAVPIARESVHAVRAELKQYTQRLTAGVLLHVRSQNSKVHKNGRYRKSETVSDLTARRPRRWQRWSNSSLQVIDPKASAVPSWSRPMSDANEGSPSHQLDGQCMQSPCSPRCLTVLRRPVWHRRARQCFFGDARDDDADRCSIPACTHSKRADTRQRRNQAGKRRNCSPPRTAAMPRGSSELSYAMRKTDNSQLWLLTVHSRQH